MNPIYLDNNATTPVDPQVFDAMLPFLKEHFGNPSCSHAYGVVTRKAVDKARRQVAQLLGCSGDELIFTSGGSESNNTAIKGLAEANCKKGTHIITSAVEHPAVSEVCRYLESHGFQVTTVPCDSNGRVDPEAVRTAITPQTILISVMHANNEVGTLQPIAEIATIAHEHDVLVHSDCAQSIGKVTVRVDDLGVDLLSLAGHKLYAPKGIGALYVRKGVKLEKLIHGAAHEQNRRAGTENVTGIVGLGMACELIAKESASDHARIRNLRDTLEQELQKHLPQIKINGHPEKRLPNTSSVSFPNIKANELLNRLEGVAASAGAACHSDGIRVSTVLQAMAVPLEFAMGTVRFSLGRFTTPEEIQQATTEIITAVRELM